MYEPASLKKNIFRGYYLDWLLEKVNKLSSVQSKLNEAQISLIWFRFGFGFSFDLVVVLASDFAYVLVSNLF